MERHFTVAVFVVDRGRVLLLQHRALRRWLPPGGHVEPGEIPDDAARREVREEAGLAIRLPRGPAGIVPGGPLLLAQPAGIQVETIGPGHEHIDLVYFAALEPGTPAAPRGNCESTRIGWFGPDEWDELGVDEEIKAWCWKAIEEAERRENGGG